MARRPTRRGVDHGADQARRRRRYHPDAGLAELEANGQILLRYAEEVNGATDRIACVINAAGNVCGLMPHPEHAVDPLLGSIDGRLLVGRLAAA